MERELLELFETAKKAAEVASTDGISSSSPEVSRCIDALKQLKKFSVTYDVLVSTQVGKKLRYLTKHPVETIKTVAADLLEIWKKVVIEETAKSKKNGSINTKPSLKINDSKAAAIKEEAKNKKNGCTNTKPSLKIDAPKAAAVKEEKVQKVSVSETVKVEKSHPDDSKKAIKVEKTHTEVKIDDSKKAIKVEKTHTEVKIEETISSRGVKRPLPVANAPPKLTALTKCNVPMRDKMRELLVAALSKVAGEADDSIRDEVNACDPIRVAISVESVMFEKMGLSGGAQKAKYRSIMFNLRDSNNPDLRRKVLLGEVQPERLITMTSEEMASEQRKLENNEIKQKALFDCERGGPQKATTDQFKCGRCGQKKCTYYQMQTRSADEPMTTYVTCVNCNNRWKFC